MVAGYPSLTARDRYVNADFLGDGMRSKVLTKKAIRVLFSFVVFASVIQVISGDVSFAGNKITQGGACKKGTHPAVKGELLFRCQGRGKAWLWNSSPINTSSSNTSTPLSEVNVPTSPLVIPFGADPHLQCIGSGELSGAHPGWSSHSAIQLTRVDLSTVRRALYWCPAAAPSGGGPISYTVTAKLGATTCQTTQTFCEMNGVPAGIAFEIMATDETGSYASPNFAIQNSGTPVLCNTAVNYCNPGPGNLTFPAYGNVAPIGIGDCTFAAVANWEEIVLGTTPDSALILSQFAEAGGTYNLGLTNSQVFNYWRDHGIGGTFLNAELPFYTDPVSLMKAIDAKAVRAVIASLNLAKGQNFAGNTMPEPSYHWVVVDGYTPQGPLVATWGTTLQMTWQQWNLEVVSMWGITTRP